MLCLGCLNRRLLNKWFLMLRRFQNRFPLLLLLLLLSGRYRFLRRLLLLQLLFQRWNSNLSLNWGDTFHNFWSHNIRFVFPMIYLFTLKTIGFHKRLHRWFFICSLRILTYPFMLFLRWFRSRLWHFLLPRWYLFMYLCQLIWLFHLLPLFLIYSFLYLLNSSRRFTWLNLFSNYISSWDEVL
jgi:hypothetical protein